MTMKDWERAVLTEPGAAQRVNIEVASLIAAPHAAQPLHGHLFDGEPHQLAYDVIAAALDYLHQTGWTLTPPTATSASSPTGDTSTTATTPATTKASSSTKSVSETNHPPGTETHTHTNPSHGHGK